MTIQTFIGLVTQGASQSDEIRMVTSFTLSYGPYDFDLIPFVEHSTETKVCRKYK